MNTLSRLCLLLILASVFTTSAISQTTQQSKQTTEMKTFLIEREIPDAAKFNAQQLKSISQKSCSVLKEMGPQIQWIHSYVAGNKIYCIYKAQNEELIREHAKKGGFPANTITEVANIISPTTAN